MIALIESGLSSDAKTYSQAMWRDSNLFYSIDNGDHTYTKCLEAKLPDYVKLFKTDGDKFFAELFFASFPNSKKSADKVESKLKERLAELAKRFPETKFKSKRIRQLTVMLLSKSPEAATAIREPLREAASHLKIEQLVERHDNELQKKLLAAWLGVEAQFGNFDPVRRVFRQANGLSDGQTKSDDSPFEDNWQVRQFLSSVSESMNSSFTKQIEVGSAEAAEKLLPILSEFNDPSLEYKLCPELNVMAQIYELNRAAVG